MNESELLNNLNEELQKVRQELGNIKKDYFPHREESADELRRQIKARDEQLANLKNFMENPQETLIRLGYGKPEQQTKMINKSNEEFTEIVENENSVDGFSFQVIKKSIPENKGIDMDIEVKNGTVRRRF